MIRGSSTFFSLPLSLPYSPPIPAHSKTNELVTNIIAAGADILTIHGRTRHQSSSAHPVNLDRISFAASCAKGAVPIVANGDVFSKQDADEMRAKTGVEGVMSARGLLANPVRPLPTRLSV